MGLNEDLGDRENVGSAALAQKRAREAARKTLRPIKFVCSKCDREDCATVDGGECSFLPKLAEREQAGAQGFGCCTREDVCTHGEPAQPDAGQGDVNGCQLIHQERNRQIYEEGWTAQHDDEHKYGELAAAASCYAHHANCQVRRFQPSYIKNRPSDWPWDAEWWKPSAFPIRNLVKAGALIAAEIDRLHRLAQSDKPRTPITQEHPLWNTLLILDKVARGEVAPTNAAYEIAELEKAQ
jgi:hypothetical protein